MRNYQTSVQLDIGHRSSDGIILMQVKVVLPVRKSKKLVIDTISQNAADPSQFNVQYNEQDDSSQTEDYLMRDTFNIKLGPYTTTADRLKLSDIVDDQIFFSNYTVNVKVNKTSGTSVINSGISDDADIDMMRGDFEVPTV